MLKRQKMKNVIAQDYTLRGLSKFPIPKRPELNGDMLFWMKRSIMKQQKA